MTTCLVSWCTRVRYVRGYCDPHYRKRLRHGLFGRREGATVLEHLGRLRALGWSWDQIGIEAGLDPSTPTRIYADGPGRRVLPETEWAILSIRPTPASSKVAIDVTGTRRRVQALSWMGWSYVEICKRVGVTESYLCQRLAAETITARVTRRICEVYEELWDKPGPSQFSRSRALKLGYAPPMAWDDQSIDDPGAKPNLGRKPRDEAARSRRRRTTLKAQEAA